MTNTNEKVTEKLRIINPRFLGFSDIVFHHPFCHTPKSKNKENRMVILPYSPLACAVVTTMLLAVTFYSGRWWGMKMMKLIEKEIEKNEGNL